MRQAAFAAVKDQGPQVMECGDDVSYTIEIRRDPLCESPGLACLYYTDDGFEREGQQRYPSGQHCVIEITYVGGLDARTGIEILLDKCVVRQTKAYWAHRFSETGVASQQPLIEHPVDKFVLTQNNRALRLSCGIRRPPAYMPRQDDGLCRRKCPIPVASGIEDYRAARIRAEVNVRGEKAGRRWWDRR